MEISDAVDHCVRAYIDARNNLTGESRVLLAIEAGKALALLACSFIGNAVGVSDPQAGLQPGRDMIERFKELAREHRDRLTL